MLRRMRDWCSEHAKVGLAFFFGVAFTASVYMLPAHIPNHPVFTGKVKEVVAEQSVETEKSLLGRQQQFLQQVKAEFLNEVKKVKEEGDHHKHERAKEALDELQHSLHDLLDIADGGFACSD